MTRRNRAYALTEKALHAIGAPIAVDVPLYNLPARPPRGTTMTDKPTTALNPIDRMRTPPDDVPDAIQRVAQIKALQSWLNDLETPIRGWLRSKADEVEALTGSAFRTEAKGVGTAHLSDPQPKPRVSDPEAFARWYVTDVLDADPDGDPDKPHRSFETVVVRTTVATVDSDELVAFMHAHAQRFTASTDDQSNQYVDRLASWVTVDVVWSISETLLDDLLAGKIDKLNEGNRLKLAGDKVIDAETGEPVPGVRVAPAGKRVLTVTPDKAIKAALAAELRAAIGPPALTDGD